MSDNIETNDKNTENLTIDLLMKGKVPKKILKLNEDFTEEMVNKGKIQF